MLQHAEITSIILYVLGNKKYLTLILHCLSTED